MHVISVDSDLREYLDWDKVSRVSQVVSGLRLKMRLIIFIFVNQTKCCQSDSLSAHHLLSLVIKLDVCHPRKTERRWTKCLEKVNEVSVESESGSLCGKGTSSLQPKADRVANGILRLSLIFHLVPGVIIVFLSVRKATSTNFDARRSWSGQHCTKILPMGSKITTWY